MQEPVTINPAPPVNDGLNYAYLKEQGTEWIQQLSGEIWTDYNESDPGVTTLEQLCYAMTELSYRAEFPLEDLLLEGPPPVDRIDPHRQALFIPRQIFPCKPLTLCDFRRILIDGVPGVANAWVDRRRPTEDHGINGLYNIILYSLDSRRSNAEIQKKAREVYNGNRSLCEDVNPANIHVLTHKPATVNSTVTITGSLSPETILAGIFFRIGNFLAPEIRRESLKSRVDRGESPDEIFNGPLLGNGFIDDDQLKPKKGSFSNQEIANIVSRSPGVIDVRDLSLHAIGQTTNHLNQNIDVPPLDILRLITKPGPDGYSIRLFENGIERKPNPPRVRRELSKLWTEYRRTYQLSAQYQEFFGMPRGSYRDVQQYYSVQNQFPNVYGINEYGLPGDSTAERQAQARQFKGYLLVFEQLLANYFAQLAHAKDLYSIDDGLKPTYFYQSLLEAVPNIEPLLIDGAKHYQRGIKKIVRNQDPAVQRRNRFLDFLLAMYAEHLDSSSVWLSSRQQMDERASEQLIRSKRTLLQQLVESTSNRGRGFDYLAKRSPSNTAGMAIKSRIQLGFNTGGSRGLRTILNQHSLDLARPETDVTHDNALDKEGGFIEEHFEPFKFWVHEHGDEDGAKTFTSSKQLQLIAQPITESHINSAASIENFRVGRRDNSSDISLVCKLPDSKWWLVGEYADDGSAVHNIQSAVNLFHHHCRQLYIVEHNLLRYGRVDQHHDPFAYNFTISAVVSACVSRDERAAYQTFVHEVIRSNAPSHIAIEYCFLTPWLLCFFERLHFRWQRALQTGVGLDSASRRLRRFLSYFRSESS